jgi:hypothetical protein
MEVSIIGAAGTGGSVLPLRLPLKVWHQWWLLYLMILGNYPMLHGAGWRIQLSGIEPGSARYAW